MIVCGLFVKGFKIRVMLRGHKVMNDMPITSRYGKIRCACMMLMNMDIKYGSRD